MDIQKPYNQITMDQVKRTQAEIKKEFNSILKEARFLAGIHGKEYYERQEELCKRLKVFIRWDFSQLNETQILQLCALCSKFRPVEPFSFLVSCSQLLTNDYQPLNKNHR